jgi:hypothetical protein
MFGFHGDVLISSIKSIPDGCKRVTKKKRGYVLAKGEATGHAHVVKDDVALYEKDGILYMANNDPCTIEHEEHGAHVIPAGKWEINIAQEYDHFEQESRRVAD